MFVCMHTFLNIRFLMVGVAMVDLSALNDGEPAPSSSILSGLFWSVDLIESLKLLGDLSRAETAPEVVPKFDNDEPGFENALRPFAV